MFASIYAPPLIPLVFALDEVARGISSSEEDDILLRTSLVEGIEKVGFCKECVKYLA